MKIAFLPFVFFCFLLCSCSNSDTDEILDQSSLKSDNYDFESMYDVNSLKADSALIAQVAILRNYIIINEDHYELSIEKDEASIYGVNPDIYDAVINDLEIGNKAIKDFKVTCDTFELLPVTNESELSFDDECLLSIDRSGRPQGSITTYGQNWGYDGTEVPIQMNTVRFSYSPRAAIAPVFRCSVNCFGVIEGKSAAAPIQG